MQSVPSVIRECPIDAVCFTAILTLALICPTRLTVVALALSALAAAHSIYTRVLRTDEQVADDEVAR